MSVGTDLVPVNPAAALVLPVGVDVVHREGRLAVAVRGHQLSHPLHYRRVGAEPAQLLVRHDVRPRVLGLPVGHHEVDVDPQQRLLRLTEDAGQRHLGTHRWW